MSWIPAFKKIVVWSDPKYDDEAKIDPAACYRDMSVMDWFSEDVMQEVMDQTLGIYGYMHEILYNEKMDMFKVIFKEDETDAEFTVDITQLFFETFFDPIIEDEITIYQGVRMNLNSINRDEYETIYKKTFY